MADVDRDRLWSYVQIIVETLRDYVTSEYEFHYLRRTFYSTFEMSAHIYLLIMSICLHICHSRAPSAQLPSAYVSALLLLLLLLLHLVLRE